MKHALVLLLCATSLLAADLKVKTVKASAATGLLPAVPVQPETTLYVHGTVQREEFVGYLDGYQGPKGREPHMAVITHCDTGTAYEIDVDAQEYREFKIPKYPDQEKFEKQVAQARKDEEKHTKATTVDTGEIRDFYGHPAKHLITTITKRTADHYSEKTVDGWYLDLPQPGCAPEYLRRNRGREAMQAQLAVLVPNSGNLPTKVMRVDPSRTLSSPTFVYTGFEPPGFAIERKSILHQTLTFNGVEESSNSIISQRIVEYAEASLDPMLFEVPAGFKKVDRLYKHVKEKHP
jgi:hypothetical protein